MKSALEAKWFVLCQYGGKKENFLLVESIWDNKTSFSDKKYTFTLSYYIEH